MTVGKAERWENRFRGGGRYSLEDQWKEVWWHAGLGLLCLSDGGGNSVYQAQGEWVVCFCTEKH